jgi:hypothetical protein
MTCERSPLTLPLSHQQHQDHSPKGVYIFGLFMEGARWDPEQEVLEDSLPSQLCCEFPDILFLPTKVITRLGQEKPNL